MGSVWNGPLTRFISANVPNAAPVKILVREAGADAIRDVPNFTSGGESAPVFTRW